MTKDESKAAEFWFRSSQDNIETAKAMLSARKFNFAMFMCQQAVEAILKGAHIVLKHDRPEYTHRLPRLLETAGLEAPTRVDELVLKIDAHYINARYKKDRFDRRVYNKRNAARLVKDAETVISWVQGQIG